jgi:hypothetical protein
VYGADHEIDRATLLIDWQLGWCVIFRDTPLGILKADKCGKEKYLNVNVTKIPACDRSSREHSFQELAKSLVTNAI